MRRLLFLILIPLFTVHFAWGQTPCSTVVGYNGTPLSFSFSGTYAWADKVIVSGPQTINTITFDMPGNDLANGAIYTDVGGVMTSLIESSTYAAVTTGWNSQSIPQTVLNGTYWVVFSSAQTVIALQGAPGTYGIMNPPIDGVWPSSPTGFATAGGDQSCVFLDYCGPINTPTCNPSSTPMCANQYTSTPTPTATFTPTATNTAPPNPTRLPTPCSPLYVMGSSSTTISGAFSLNDEVGNLFFTYNAQTVDTLWMYSDGTNTLYGNIAICTNASGNYPGVSIVNTIIAPPNHAGWVSVTVAPVTLDGSYWIIGQWQDGTGLSYVTPGSTIGFTTNVPPSLISPPIVSWTVSSNSNALLFADYCGSNNTATPTGTLTPSATPTNTTTPDPIACGISSGISIPPTPGREETVGGAGAGFMIDGNEWSTSVSVMADGFNVWLGPGGPSGSTPCDGSGDYPVTLLMGLYNWNFQGGDKAYLIYQAGPVTFCAHSEFVFVPGPKQMIAPGNYLLAYLSPFTSGANQFVYLCFWPYDSATEWNVIEPTYTGSLPTSSYFFIDSNAQLQSNNVDTCPATIPNYNELMLLGVGR